MIAKTLQSLDTGYTADSVEWCPNENYTDLVAFGTYQLVEQSDGPNVRKGRIHLLRLDQASR